MPLTEAFTRSVKPLESVKKYSDGGGLHLRVEPRGSKLWRMQYTFGNKQKSLTFGKYPIVSLAEARRKRDEARKLIANGIDPAERVRIEKIAKKVASGNTFNAVADDLLAKAKRDGKAEATMTKKRWLLDMARVHFGDRPIAEITAIEILVPLRKVEAAGNYETARRLRATIGQVFRYAIATARAENDPTFGLRGALTTPKVTHRAALTDRNAFAGLLRAVWTYEGSPETQAALKLMAYLHTRPGELRLAEWPELDLDAAIWTIPGSRMKMRREHRKPLPRQAVELFRAQKEVSGVGRFLFPSIKTRRQPISENTLNGALRRLGFTKDEMTSHGFRASANSLLNESGKWNPDAIEVEQSRMGADEVRRAYHRAQYWEERVRMQQWWADEIDRMRSSKPEELQNYPGGAVGKNTRI